MKEIRLISPLNESDVRNLSIGDVIYLSGRVYQILGPGSTKAMEYAKRKEKLPFELENGVICHIYSSIKKINKDWKLNYAGVSTSTYLPIEPDFIRNYKIRALIGKGGVGKETIDAMKEVGCVYLAFTGGCAALFTTRVKGLEAIYWEDTPERVIAFKVEALGPLIVGIDARGNSVYEKIDDEVKKRLLKIRIMSSTV